ncbi:MAG: class I lanthipeptide [Bacteroidota bacterium]
MKKKDLSKLSLNKKAISKLDAGIPKAGQGGPAPTPPVAIKCSSPNPCSVKPTCLISYYASDCWWI